MIKGGNLGGPGRKRSIPKAKKSKQGYMTNSLVLYKRQGVERNKG